MNLGECFSLLSTHCADSGATSKLLQDILVKLQALDEGTLQDSLNSFVSALFSVWSRLDEECIVLAAKVLREMFTKCGIELVFSNVSTNIFWGLKEGPPSLKEAVLEVITTGFEANTVLVRNLPLDTLNSLLTAIVHCVADENSLIGEKAQKLLVLIAKVPTSVSIVFKDPASVQLLHSMVVNNGSLRIRLYDLMCSLIAVSEDLLELCIKEGFMDAMLKDIRSNDLLIQLNVIELLTDLILRSPFSMKFFYSNNVLPILHNLLTEAQANPDGGLQHVALVKFFGCFLGRYPKECVEAYPDFLQLIYSYVRFYDSLPIGLRLLAFDTIALAASAPEGKRILANQGAAMKEAMECLGRAMRNGTLDIRVRHLEALEKIFTVEDPSEINEFSELLLDWFNSIYSDRTPQQLFSLIKGPFESHQVAMYKVLRALALFRWFPQKIKEAEGFFDFLISRAELSTEAQHVKFELIQRLASNPEVKIAFNSVEQMKLTEYIRHGATYYKAVPQLATE
ncbi:hypothetical protein M514_05805 [Trichuris suis]|uniref:26S proteasome non-ATPase regulatory subunit 5 n=1 Tax=Trichuris suis TaxID=68888 RepID=A0A085NAC0_9BILA|nr:hypothetical protein M513_05805 [Trichuris suis]KFD66416.1 hypothetical protein M514_05805 [Trichuris suis]KHJ42894.1 hypothetical protein D918_06978 [Trichuris suis]